MTKLIDIENVEPGRERAPMASIPALDPVTASLLDALPAFAYIQDESLNVIYATPGMVEYYGSPAGRTCFDFLGRGGARCPDCGADRVLAGEPPGRDEEIGLSDGRIILVRKSRWIDDEGRRYIVNMGTDVTAIREADARSRALIENSSDITLVLDPRRRVTFISNAFSRVLGHRADDVLGTTVTSLLHPEDYAVISADLLRVFRTPGMTYRSDPVRIRHAEGHWVFIEGTLVNCIEVAGIGGVVVNGRDVTDEQRARGEMDKYLGMTEHAAYGALILSLDGDVLYANPAFCGMIGYRPEDLVGVGFEWLSRPANGMTNVDLVRRIQGDGKLVGEEIVLTTCGGGSVPVLATAHMVPDEHGQPAYVSCTAVDISERKKAEAEVLRLNRELELRVEERTRELEKANERLLEAEKMAALGNLVAGVAHELNTPVGVSVTAASHLAARAMEIDAAMQEGRVTRSDFTSFMDMCRESTALVLENLRRTSSLVEQFKRTAVGAAHGKLTSAPLAPVVAGLERQFERVFGDLGYALDVDCRDDLEAVFDRDVLEMCLDQLLNNAVRHGFAGRREGTVRLVAEQVGERVTIRVMDDGEGMAPDVRTRVFEPFFTTRRVNQGAGLGLHIVYNQVTGTLGGHLSCWSEPGEGSVFTLELKTS